MKDPNYAEEWVDTLALRVQHGQAAEPGVSPPTAQLDVRGPLLSEVELEERLRGRMAHLRLFDQLEGARPRSSTPPAHVDPAFRPVTMQEIRRLQTFQTRFTRTSPKALATIRNLPKKANIVLFTPVIIPVNDTDYATNPTTDPFEPLGRALSSHHSRIRHVPYIAQTGFTDTHNEIARRADAVVTVICEPDRQKQVSVTNQMEFAEAALDAFCGDDDGDDVDGVPFVLVQLVGATDQLEVDENFETVVRCTRGGGGVAGQNAVAHAIFKG